MATKTRLIRIPGAEELKELPREQVLELFKHIKPVISDIGKLYYLDDTDPVSTSYLWDGKQANEATDITLFAEMFTLHRIGIREGSVFREVFAPTVSEVLSQIPKEYFERTAAFEIRIGAVGTTDNCYHRALTYLYERKQQ